MGIQGLAELRARLNERIPQAVMETLRDQIEKEAQKLVGQMQAKVTQEGIKIDWTWGDTPAGAVSIGTVRNNSYARLAVTVYAMGFSNEGKGAGHYPLPAGFPAIARWAEFGTADRFQWKTGNGKYTGRIQEGAYFYPTYRERRKNIRSNITRAIKRGIKNA